MALKKVYFGSVGPFVYDDATLINDPDGDFAGEDHRSMTTDGQLHVEQAPVDPNEVVRKIDLDALDGLAIVALLEALAAGDRLSHDDGLSDVSSDDHHAQVHDVNSHSDVNLAGLANNDLWRWHDPSSKWLPKSIAEVISGQNINPGAIRVALTIFANNAAAVIGGLVAGDFYRNGADPDLVCVVH